MVIGAAACQPLVADDEDRITRLQLRCCALQVNAHIAGLRNPGDAGLHSHRVPIGFGQNLCRCLEGLRRLALRGHALHLRALAEW